MTHVRSTYKRRALWASGGQQWRCACREKDGFLFLSTSEKARMMRASVYFLKGFIVGVGNG